MHDMGERALNRLLDRMGEPIETTSIIHSTNNTVRLELYRNIINNLVRESKDFPI